jgi:hypothetical protein
MSINWISTNPKPNIKNKANQTPASDADYENLMRAIIHVTQS